MPSKEFEQLQNIIYPPRVPLVPEDEITIRNRELEQKKIQDAENAKIKELLKRIKEDELILEKSGVESLFKEIRDSGFVKYTPMPVYQGEVKIFKPGFLGIKTFDHSEKRIIRNYHPAMIYKNNTESNIGKTLEDIKSEVSISLVFKGVPFGKYSDGTYYDEIIRYSAVKISVINKKLNLAHPPAWRSDVELFTPIEDGKLIETIAEAIKDPEMEMERSGDPEDEKNFNNSNYKKC